MRRIIKSVAQIVFAVSAAACTESLTLQQATSSNQEKQAVAETTALAASGTVTQVLTYGDKSALFQVQASTPSFGTATNNYATVELNQGSTFQIIDGFGYTLTQGSAYVMMNQMTSAQRTSLLTELFNSSSGIGISFIRIGIGATDLSSSVYTYNDLASGTDVSQTNFSLNGPDLTYLIPVIKEILVIAPNIKIIATPWSAPKWMKSNSSYVGGSLNTAYYDSYATYFVKYIQAMKAQGIDIYAVTPQNEPENPNNNPSMTMTATEETNFIAKLGPAFQTANITTKIIVFDHNCDNPTYPTTVLNSSAGVYADGAAFHLYAGSISAMTTVHNNTGKNVYFTEQFTSSSGNFSGDLGWHMQNVMIGGTNNWAKTALEWNLATDAAYGPYTPGGCSTCLGAVTINNGSYTRNVSYYIVAHMSKYIRPGAVRASTTSTNTGLIAAGFVNSSTNGSSKVLVVYNNKQTNTTFNIKYNGQIATVTLKKKSVGTYIWN